MKYLYCLSNNNDIRFGGHYVCATKVNDVYYLNDDNKPIRIVSHDFVQKNSVLLAIRHGNVQFFRCCQKIYLPKVFENLKLFKKKQYLSIEIS